MNKKSSSANFWSENFPKWNFGDAITAILYEKLFYRFIPYSTPPHVIGSVIFDGILSLNDRMSNDYLPHYRDGRDCKAVFWGCGLRDELSLSKDLHDRVALLGVRGPLSASALRLGGEVPTGDPGLFLPALYQPRPHVTYAGKTVCIPHYNDARSDEEILTASGCDVVLRPGIEPNVAAAYRFIDAICCARFVLAGALHGAITAAAYGIPFAYWESGDIDLPFKWRDFSALVGISCDFMPEIADGERYYKENIEGKILLPSLWPLLSVAPAFIRPAGLMKVLNWELRNHHGEATIGLEELISKLELGETAPERLADLACRLVEDIVPALWREKDEAATTALENAAEIHRLHEEIHAANTEIQAVNAEKAQHFSEKTNLERMRAELSEKLGEAAGEVDRLERERVNSIPLIEDMQRQLVEMEEIGAKAARSIGSMEAERLLKLLSEKGIVQATGQDFSSVLAGAADTTLRVKDSLEAVFSLVGESWRARQMEVDADRQRHSHELETLHQEINRLMDDLTNTKENKQLSDQKLVAARQEIHILLDEIEAGKSRFNVAIARLGAILRRIRRHKAARIALKLPIIKKYDARIQRNADLIENFIGQFSEVQLRHSSEGRLDRVVGYLMGATSYVPDFPLLDRNVYYALNPDVAAEKMDPFIHYIKYGKEEGRTPHPLIDYEFYTARYPETKHLSQSILEHFVLFGAAKGYNPSPWFDTASYYARYQDVKASGRNPVLHYLQYPGCQPHADFDSHYYCVHNPDVVRAGINPLVHYLLWGKAEGRMPRSPASNAGIGGEGTAPMDQRALPSIDGTGSPKVGPAGGMSRNAATETKPLVVMIDAFFPRPEQDSGSLDQVNYAKIFQQLGYEVAFAALLEFGAEEKVEKSLHEIGVTCIKAKDYLNIEEYIFLNSDRIHSFFLSRFNFGGNWIRNARFLCPRAQIIFNTVDLHHVREERQALLFGEEKLAEQARATKDSELACISAADVTIVVSKMEQDLLKEIVPAADVRMVPLIREIVQRPLPEFKARSGIAFVGGFQHLPNVDAVTYFLDEIWPFVLAKDPAMRFHVIGSHMPTSLSERADANVEWVGQVPTLELWLDKVRITVAPLRYGAGAKGKVVSSLLNGVPCVTSSLASEGMGFPEGHGVVSADTPETFAERILALHQQETLWSDVSERGLAAVKEAYSLERGKDLVAQFVPEHGKRPH